MPASAEIRGARFPPEPLLQAALAFAAPDQARNTLLVSMLDRGLREPDFRRTLYVASASRGGEITALAVRSEFPKLALSADAPPGAVEGIAARVRKDMPDLPCVLGPKAEARRFLDGWRRSGDAAPVTGMRERIYQLDHVIPHAPVSGELQPATAAELPLLLDWIRRFDEELGQTGLRSTEQLEAAARRYVELGSAFIWHAGPPVCMVGAGGPAGLAARIGPVYTPPEHRRRAMPALLSRPPAA